jgi:hypothetical protein
MPANSDRDAMTRVRAEQRDRQAVIAAAEAWEEACTYAHTDEAKSKPLLTVAELITAGDRLRELLLEKTGL